MDEVTLEVHGGVRNRWSLHSLHLKTMSVEEVGGAVNRLEGDRWRS